MTRKTTILGILMLILLAMAIHAVLRGTGTVEVFAYLGIGIVLGVIAMIRGGELPDWVHRRRRIQRDHDPGNIPARVYLPIIAVVLIIAAVLFVLYGLR